jgi:hypothetical protein
MRTAKISDINYITIGLDPVLLGTRVGSELDPWHGGVMILSCLVLALAISTESDSSTYWSNKDSKKTALSSSSGAQLSNTSAASGVSTFRASDRQVAAPRRSPCA